MVSLKPDWACALQRKTPENLLTGFDWTLSPVLFAGKTCGIAAIFSDSCSNVAGFLCHPDCVAERLRFEPSLPFVRSLRADVCATYNGFCNLHVSSGELLQYSNRGKQSLLLFSRMANAWRLSLKVASFEDLFATKLVST